jgi:hypothetical protein
MKTRSSSGVNSKIDLEFDVDTLRISDTEQEEDSAGAAPQSAGSAIVSALKRNNTVNTAPDHPDRGQSMPKVSAEVDSTRLRNFINNLGSE